MPASLKIFLPSFVTKDSRKVVREPAGDQLAENLVQLPVAGAAFALRCVSSVVSPERSSVDANKQQTQNTTSEDVFLMRKSEPKELLYQPLIHSDASSGSSSFRVYFTSRSRPVRFVFPSYAGITTLPNQYIYYYVQKQFIFSVHPLLAASFGESFLATIPQSNQRTLIARR